MIVTEFCKKLKAVSSNFSIMKNIVALSSSGFPIKLTCYLKSGFSNSICLLKSIAISLQCFENTYSPINYQLCNHYSY